MNANSQRGRYLLWAGAALIFVIAPVIIAGVIPAIGTYASPYARPGFTVIMLWTCAVFSCLAALTLAFVAACVRKLDSPSAFLLCAVMMIALLFSFALSDAAFAIQSRGPALQLAAVLLHLCSAVNFIVPLLIIVATVRLPKRRDDATPPQGGAIVEPSR